MKTVLSEVKQTWKDRRDNETDFVRLARAGFYSATLGSGAQGTSWREIHEWCRAQFGNEHYTWTGSTFWFETEQDAVLFNLRWS